MTPEEIRKILDDHEKWLEDEDDGERRRPERRRP